MKTHQVELVKNVKKKTFLILKMKFVEDILANTRGQSKCRGDNDPPKEGEFVMK